MCQPGLFPANADELNGTETWYIFCWLLLGRQWLVFSIGWIMQNNSKLEWKKVITSIMSKVPVRVWGKPERGRQVSGNSRQQPQRRPTERKRWPEDKRKVKEFILKCWPSTCMLLYRVLVRWDWISTSFQFSVYIVAQTRKVFLAAHSISKQNLLEWKHAIDIFASDGGHKVAFLEGDHLPWRWSTLVVF